MRVFGEDGEEEETRDEIITEPSSIFNRLVIGKLFMTCSSSHQAIQVYKKTKWAYRAQSN